MKSKKNHTQSHNSLNISLTSIRLKKPRIEKSARIEIKLGKQTLIHDSYDSKKKSRSIRGSQSNCLPLTSTIASSTSNRKGT